MGYARKHTMNPLEVEMHHCWSRVVQGQFLMGIAPDTQVDRSYRQEVLMHLREYLASILFIEVGAAHTMSNHVHDIVRNRPDLVKRLSDEEVLWRDAKAWPKLYKGSRGWDCDPTDQDMRRRELRAKNEEGYMERVRRSLADISFYQQRLKQETARQFNRDEGTAGHYWGGPFGNRKIETPEDGVCSFLYCDLQKAKAGLITDLADSDFSTIQAQIKSQAQLSFMNMTGRDPRDTDEDARMLEELEVLLSNCWFSPLDHDAPLSTEVDDDPPESELVYPVGYTYQQPGGKEKTDAAIRDLVLVGAKDDPNTNVIAVTETTTETGNEMANETGNETGNVSERPDEANGTARMSKKNNKEQQETNSNSSSCQATQRSRRPGERGRPRNARTYEINNRYKRELRRRASRCNLLGLIWEEYEPLVRSIAEKLINDRPTYFPPPEVRPNTPEYPEGCDPPDATPAKFQRGLNDFSDWCRTRAAEAFSKLVSLLPRAPDNPEEDSS